MVLRCCDGPCARLQANLLDGKNTPRTWETARWLASVHTQGGAGPFGWEQANNANATAGAGEPGLPDPADDRLYEEELALTGGCARECRLLGAAFACVVCGPQPRSVCLVVRAVCCGAAVACPFAGSGHGLFPGTAGYAGN